MNPGNKYIALVLGLLGFSVATCVVLIGYATHDPTFAVEKNYYQKAVAFDQIRAEEVASDRLGWKVLVAPAMNGKMWQHPATQQNVATLKSRGVQFVGPDSGMLSCGYEGVGRLEVVDEIVRRAGELLG